MAVLEWSKGLEKTNVAVLLSSAFFFGFILFRIVATIRQFYRLRHIKGPPIAGFSKWWLVSKVAGRRAHLDYYEVCQKYGK